MMENVPHSGSLAIWGRCPGIIGIAGVSGVGKTTLADALERFLGGLGFEVARWKFAGALRSVAWVLYPGVAVDATPLSEEARQVLQSVGTALRTMDADIFVKRLEWEWGGHKHAFGRVSDSGGTCLRRVVLIDDVRYENEAAWIRKNGGMVLKLEHSRKISEGAHESERSAERLVGDYVLLTRGSAGGGHESGCSAAGVAADKERVFGEAISALVAWGLGGVSSLSAGEPRWTLYLAGAITGRTPEEAGGWRKEVEERLGAGECVWDVRNPLRGISPGLASGAPIPREAFTEAMAAQDIADIFDAQVILVHPGAAASSIGTQLELALARRLGKWILWYTRDVVDALADGSWRRWVVRPETRAQ